MQLSGWIPMFWLLLGMQFFASTNCNAVIRVKFLSYVNRQGLTHDGHVCDSRIWFSSTSCDPFFTIRLSVVGGKQMKLTTGAASNKNWIYFRNKIVNLANPIVFEVSKYTVSLDVPSIQRWTPSRYSTSNLSNGSLRADGAHGSSSGQLDVEVRVDDYDSLTAHDYMGTFWHRYSGDAVPFGQHSEAPWLRLVDNGWAKAILTLEITVQCSANYYGRHCERFCQPGSDSRTGYYSCSADGRKICRSTFNPATNCRSTYCDSQPCHNGGACSNLPTGFICACKELFGGATCTERLTACQHNEPCHNGGTCHAGVGCQCPPEFHGDACELDIDECLMSSPCRGNGSVCKNWYGNYSCSCGQGWRGRHCTEDIDECAQTTPPACENNGLCENTIGSFACLCLPGFRGKYCEEDIDECNVRSGDRGLTSSPCHGNGSFCENLIGNYSCICGPGWRGRNCTEDIDECSDASGLDGRNGANSTACLNGGRCENILGGFTCHCEKGFLGDRCELDIDECIPGANSTTCLNGGMCENIGGGFTCHCPRGFQGDRCQMDIDECNPGSSSTACLNGGRCENILGGFSCDCPRGFQGDRCELDIDECMPGANSTACLNGGRCENNLGGFTCHCPRGFQGDRCQLVIDECYDSTGFGGRNGASSKACLNGGRCENSLGGFTCHCPRGFQGDNDGLTCYCLQVVSCSTMCPELKSD